jgi:hypothetical protein
VLLLLLARHLPESPRYLLAQGDAAAAQAVLQRIAAVNGKQLHFVEGREEAVWDQTSADIVMPQLHQAASLQQQQQQQQAQYHGMDDDSRGTSNCNEQQQLLGGRDTAVSDGTQQQQQHKADHTLKVEASQQHCPISNSNSSSFQARDDPTIRISAKDQQRQPQHLPTTHAISVPGAPTWQQQQQVAGANSPADRTSCDTNRDPSQMPLNPNPHKQQQQGTVLGSQQLQQLLAEGRLAASLLSQPPYAKTTALLLFAWAATSFAYYGLVQLVAQLHLEVSGPAAAAAEGGGATCTDGSLQVRRLVLSPAVVCAEPPGRKSTALVQLW